MHIHIHNVSNMKTSTTKGNNNNSWSYPNQTKIFEYKLEFL